MCSSFAPVPPHPTPCLFHTGPLAALGGRATVCLLCAGAHVLAAGANRAPVIVQQPASRLLWPHLVLLSRAACQPSEGRPYVGVRNLGRLVVVAVCAHRTHQCGLAGAGRGWQGRMLRSGCSVGAGWVLAALVQAVVSVVYIDSGTGGHRHRRCSSFSAFAFLG